MSKEVKETSNLFKALCNAQKAFKPAIKDTANPFFKSKYADLSSIWDACKDALADNDLFVSQSISVSETGPVLITKVFHITGECIESTCPIICGKQNDPQAFGSAVTYTRRYSLAPILGIITDDDDAEGAMVRPAASMPAKASKPATSEQKELYKELLQDDTWNDEQREAGLTAMATMDYDKMAQTIGNMQKKIKAKQSA